MKRVANIHDKNEKIDGSLLIKKEISTNQLCSMQDHTAMGSYTSDKGLETDWIAAYDGHGGNTAIEVVRESDLDTIMQDSEPHVKLQEMITAESERLLFGHKKYITGATFIQAKVLYKPESTDITITNIGDSRALLFVNGEPIFVSSAQDYDNGREMLRLMKEKRLDENHPIIRQSTNFDLISPTRILGKIGTYINFVVPNGDRMTLSPSQSLGHMGVCGFAPDVTTFCIKPTDEFKLFLFSDGVSDVIPIDGISSDFNFYQRATSAKEVIEEAERRWKQQWVYNSSKDLRTNKFTTFPFNGYDDCCCAMIERSTIVESVPNDIVIIDDIVVS